MRGTLARGAVVALMALTVLAAWPALGPDGAMGAKPRPTPTAPPDLVASYRRLCERMPPEARDRCLLGIVEQLGWLAEEEPMLGVCKAIADPLDQGICYGVARSDPGLCAGINGEVAAMERELCIGSVAETLCFRGPIAPERDACLMKLAVKVRGPLGLGLACASIQDDDQRHLCSALVALDPRGCDRILDPATAADCRKRIQQASSGPTGATGPATVGGQTWSGAFPAVSGSSLRLSLGADGQLTGSGTVPVTDNPALSAVALTVTSSTGGPDAWNGDMSVVLVGKDGKVQMDALSGLASSDAVGWRATRSGDQLVGTVDQYGDFVLSPPS
jgi:hypothetical protein